MVKYLQYKKKNNNATIKYICGCGSYISAKGAVKHERTEKHLKVMDVEPAIENIDIFQAYIFSSSARINNFEKPLTL